VKRAVRVIPIAGETERRFCETIGANWYLETSSGALALIVATDPQSTHRIEIDLDAAAEVMNLVAAAVIAKTEGAQAAAEFMSEIGAKSAKIDESGHN